MLDTMSSMLGNPGMMSGSPVPERNHQSSSPMSCPSPVEKKVDPMSLSLSLSSSAGSEDLFSNSKCKRKISFTHIGLPRTHQPATVARRNARERNRVKQVNNGFAALKQHIPLGHRSKKMSKVETLRCAVEYIKNLKGMLDSEVNQGSSGAQVQSQVQKYLAAAAAAAQNGDQLSPSSSEDPSSPSYASASEGSYVTSTSTPFYDYENYEPVSPEDEELLDAISWWQQS